MMAHPLTTHQHTERQDQKPQKHHVSEKIQTLETQLKEERTNLHVINQLVTAYIQRAKHNNQSLYLKKAEALITEALQRYPLAQDLQMHRVDILQHTHRFDEALELLESIIAKTPKEAEPYLVQATIYQAEGEFNKALSSCKHLILRSSHLLSTTCITMAQSHLGKLAQSYEVLKNLYAKNIYHEKSEKLWALTSLSDMAYRLGDKKSSLGYLKEALEIKPDEHFVLKKVSDLYLESKEYSNVKKLLKNHLHIDALFLRHTVARSKLGESIQAEKKSLKSFLHHLKSHDEKPHLEDLSYYEALGL